MKQGVNDLKVELANTEKCVLSPLVPMNCRRDASAIPVSALL